MSDAYGRVIAFVALFLLLLASLAWAQANGFVSSRVTLLWAQAIVHVDGPARFTSTDAFYPPLPFVLSLAAQGISGGTAIPVPFILSAALGALLLLFWFANLHKNGGFSFCASALAIALLAVNPYFLRVVADGPEAVLTMMGTWVFARGIVNLRLSGAAPDMMKVAVGLLIVTLSNSYGLLICLGALPFMVVAARPSMLVASPAGYLISMFYPVVAAVLSMVFVSQIFDSALLPLLTEEPIRLSLGAHALILLGLAPMVLVAIFRNVLISRYFMPLLAAFGTICGAYLLNGVFHVEADPTMALAPMLAVGAAALRFWPAVALRAPIVITLLALGAVLSSFAFRQTPVGETADWVHAFQGERLETSILTQDVALFLGNKTGIMVDVERNPEIVTALGGVEQLIVAGQPLYDWAMEGGMARARFILVQTAPGQAVETDRVLRRYPDLLSDRPERYSEVFRNARWRVFERTES